MPPTAIAVLVPELETVVGGWRATFTRDGAREMPPHVTLLYPFADDDAAEWLLPDVSAALAGCAPFEVTFAAARRWPDILYLAPAPPEPFVALVERLVGAFPQYPPYGGAHDDVVPHLTVAQGDAERFDAIEAEVVPALPVRVRVERAWLMSEKSGSWRRHTSFPLDRR